MKDEILNMKMIDIIRNKIRACKDNNIKPSVIILHKSIEREMFLDGSFPKNINVTNLIEIDEISYIFLITEDINTTIKVVGNEKIK